MHDPMTVAFDIRNPFVRPDKHGYRPPLVTVWHVDPETDHTDDSCDWFGRKRPLDEWERELAQAIWRAESVFGNRPYYEAAPGGALDRGHQAFEEIRKASYPWRSRHGRRWHPRWHVHHWKVVIEPWAAFWRRRERCAMCGERMGRSVRIGSWGGDKVFHSECYHSSQAVTRG